MIIVTRSYGPVGPLFPVGTNHSQSLDIPIIVRRNHPSFAGCNILASVETETGHFGDRADFLPFKQGAMSLSRVLNYNNVFSTGQVRYSGNVGVGPVAIHWHSRLRLPRHTLPRAFTPATIRVLTGITEKGRWTG